MSDTGVVIASAALAAVLAERGVLLSIRSSEALGNAPRPVPAFEPPQVTPARALASAMSAALDQTMHLDSMDLDSR